MCVERHIEGVVAELGWVLQHSRAEVHGHLGVGGGGVPQSWAGPGGGLVYSVSLGDSPGGVLGAWAHLPGVGSCAKLGQSAKTRGCSIRGGGYPWGCHGAERSHGGPHSSPAEAQGGAYPDPSAGDWKWSHWGGGWQGKDMCFLLGTLKMLKGLLSQSPGGAAVPALREAGVKGRGTTG